MLFRQIDNQFKELEDKFTYKMQKSLAKQLDIDLFSDDVRAHRNFKLTKRDYSLSFNNLVSETCKQCFDESVLAVWLDCQSLQQDINQLIQQTEKMHRALDKAIDKSDLVVDDFNVLIQKARICFADKQFILAFINVSQQFSLQLKDHLLKTTQLENQFRGRLVQLK